MEEGRALPVGWAVSPLLEAGDLIRGVTYSKKDASDLPFENSIPVLRANNIQNGSLWLEGLVHVPFDLVSEEQRIKAGDIVIATSSGSISVVGKAAQAKSDLGAGFGAFCGLVRPSSNLCARYLGHFFGTDYYRNSVSSMARGVNINNLKKSHFEELRLPLAPLNEQRRIAAKLDTALAAVDSCRQRLDGVEALLKRFRQAVLAAATSGELTREWREERGIDDPEATTLGDIIKVSSGKFMPAKAMDPSGTIPVYGGNGIAGYHSEANVDEPTVAIGRVGFYCGSVHLTPEKAWVTDNALIVKSKRSEMDRDFLYYALLGTNLRSNDSSTAQPVISGAKIYPVPFLIPSFDEQREIVARVEALFSLADQLEAKLTAARRIVERLTPALLAKAFRGELVPQDPNDEPASVLLERIRAARLAEAAAGKPSRRGRKQVAAIPAAGVSDAAPVPPDSLPPDLLTCLLRECGPLTERALLAASELRPETFRVQLAREQDLGAVRVSRDAGQVLLEAVA